MSLEMIERLSFITVYIFVFICGACIGSFLNVCILRLPKGESIIKRNSHCMTCGAPIKARDLVPIFSYIFLRGRCRNCGEKISPRYMIVELLTALLFVAVFVRHDFLNYGFIYPALLCLFIAALVVVTFEDFDTQTMSLSVLLFSGGFAVAQTIYTQFARRAAYFVDVTGITLQSRIIGLFAVSVPLLIIGFVITPLVYRKAKSDAGPVYGFGMGDVVLMGSAGLMIGVKAVVVAAFTGIILGAVYGIILKHRKNDDEENTDRFAFGPCLCIGIAVAMFFGNSLADAYLNLIRF